jgi:hypothetical protein
MQNFSSWPDLPFYWLSTNVPLFLSPSAGAGVVFVDDRAVDYSVAVDQGNGIHNRYRLTAENGLTSWAYNPEDLWIELRGATNDTGNGSMTADLLIHAPSPSVYDVFYTSTLPATNGWYWLARARPEETNIVIAGLCTNAGFFILGTTNGEPDPATGLTAACMGLVGPNAVTNDFNQNGIPDIWEVTYLGGLQPGTNDIDNNGVSIFDEYWSHLDPNVISFSLATTNRFITTNLVLTHLGVASGIPASIAVLVNDTNFAAAVWQPYSGPNVSVSLGTNDGNYTVWIGLRGRDSKSAQTWHAQVITLDRVAPAIQVTSPATSTVSQAVLQLRGIISETPASILFDISNAAGSLANQPAYLTGAQPDTNTWRLGTNYFQCYDVMLANGLNSITIRATDFAGNTSSANINLMLDDSGNSNAPVLAIDWPASETLVAGETFTLSGTVDDPGVIVAVIGPDLQSHIATVERTGRFSVPDLALPDQTNVLTLTATNAGGAGISMPLTVLRSPVTVALDPPSGAQLSQPNATLTGTVTDANYDVWVNGIQANIDSTGRWEADDVPMNNHDGSAQVDVTLYPPGTDPNGATAAAAQEWLQRLPPLVRASSYVNTFVNKKVQFGCNTYSSSFLSSFWESGVGGQSINLSLRGYIGAEPYGLTNVAEWPANSPPLPPWQNVSAHEASSVWKVLYDCNNGFVEDTRFNHLETRVELVAGGPAIIGESQLVRLTFSAAGYSGTLLDGYGPQSGPAGDVPLLASSFESPGIAITPTATNEYVGEAFVQVPAGATKAIPFSVHGTDSYSFTAQAEPISLRLLMGTNDVTGTTNTVIVGQPIRLTCALSSANAALTNFEWTVPGFAISNYVPTVNSGVVFSNFPTTFSNVMFYWVDGATNRQVECSAEIEKHKFKATTTFTILRPIVNWTLTPKSSVAVNTNYGANIHGEYFLHVGDYFYTTNEVGMYFSYEVLDHYSYGNNWSFEFIQLAAIDWRENLDLAAHASDYIVARGVDNGPDGYWYKRFFFRSGSATDSPASRLVPVQAFEWRTDQFECYLMFHPEGGIPVPLKLANWNWTGRAERLTTNVPALFRGVSPFIHPQPAIGVDSQVIPQWTNTMAVLKTNWSFNAFWYPTP